MTATGEYILIVKTKKEFQKALNQWKHIYAFTILWTFYDTITEVYHALILRYKLK